MILFLYLLPKFDPLQALLSTIRQLAQLAPQRYAWLLHATEAGITNDNIEMHIICVIVTKR